MLYEHAKLYVMYCNFSDNVDVNLCQHLNWSFLFLLTCYITKRKLLQFLFFTFMCLSAALYKPVSVTQQNKHESLLVINIIVRWNRRLIYNYLSVQIEEKNTNKSFLSQLNS